jgi:tripartite-type tricarboxylate transporter receptor subunit TctC
MLIEIAVRRDNTRQGTGEMDAAQPMVFSNKSLTGDITMTTRRQLLQTAGAITMAPWAAWGQSSNWPVKSVRIVVPSAAGSPWDPMARHLADRLSTAFGQSFYVENRSGGTGLIGMDQVAKSQDAHTLGVMFMPHTVLPSMLAKMPYDTLKDLVPISQTQWTYNVLVVRSSMPVRDINDLVSLAKKSPGKLIYSSGGAGSPANLMGEYFKQLTGTFILHVPYRGPVAALQGLIGEQSDMMFASVAAALPHIKSGRLRAIAVTSSERLDALPDTPTFGQVGFTQFDVRDWAGLVGPSALPPAVVERLNAEVVKALSEPGLAQRFAQMGVYLQTSTASGFGDWVRKEIPKWATVVRSANLKME